MSRFAHWQRWGWLTATSLAWALVLSSQAIAQPKPALVRGVDDPGRDPYQQMVNLSVTAANCGVTLTACAATFAPVPAGKRLIVTHASVFFSLSSPVNPYSQVSLVVPTAIVFLPIAQETGPGTLTFVSTTPLTFYAEAGVAPFMLIQTSGASAAVSILATLSGYYIAVP